MKSIKSTRDTGDRILNSMIKALAGQKRRRKVWVCKNYVLTWFILGLLVLGINLLEGGVQSTTNFYIIAFKDSMKNTQRCACKDFKANLNCKLLLTYFLSRSNHGLLQRLKISAYTYLDPRAEINKEWDNALHIVL